MDKEHSIQLPRGGKSTSTQKALRVVLLAILFHTYWPKRLSREEIIDHLAYFYGRTPNPALYRDLQTLTVIQVEPLPEPPHPQLDDSVDQHRQFRTLPISHHRPTATFSLTPSF